MAEKRRIEKFTVNIRTNAKNSKLSVSARKYGLEQYYVGYYKGKAPVYKLKKVTLNGDDKKGWTADIELSISKGPGGGTPVPTPPPPKNPPYM